MPKEAMGCPYMDDCSADMSSYEFRVHSLSYAHWRRPNQIFFLKHEGGDGRGPLNGILYANAEVTPEWRVDYTFPKNGQ